jgi:hypothetical protein
MAFVDDLNERYFGGALSSEVMRLLGPINDHRPEVRNFVERMFRQLHTRRLPPTDFAENLAWSTGSILPGVLPGAWGGAVPPVTQKGRHAAIDEYLATNSWRSVRDGDRLLDIGCGFPPLTTLDSAARFPALQIVGADPSFGEYLVREANGDYAVFGRDNTLLYFQPGILSASAWGALYRDPSQTRARFVAHLQRLRAESCNSRRVTRDGIELVREPIADYVGPNVSFTQLGIGATGMEGFAAIRCFNVLYYFDDAFRQEALRWFADILIDGGIAVTGADWSASCYARYTVHRAAGGTMVPTEFAFSIENVRPLHFSSMFALHDDDHDACLMSSLIGTLRSDQSFRTDIDRRLDEIQSDLRICPRKPNGFLGTAPKLAGAKAQVAAPEAIGSALERDGFAERAVEVLGRSGYRAWLNAVGHVAIDPTTGPLPEI